eukprot:365672-Chlamydomonas_euryale.AAC.5
MPFLDNTRAPPPVSRYHKIIDCIVANGMEPMCTLHHFTHPKWFQDMGAFETEDNIPVRPHPNPLNGTALLHHRHPRPSEPRH